MRTITSFRNRVGRNNFIHRRVKISFFWKSFVSFHLFEELSALTGRTSFKIIIPPSYYYRQFLLKKALFACRASKYKNNISNSNLFL